MILIGLTGSIGMGKTETARMFRRFHVPVYDADATVHALYEKGGAAVAPIAEIWPKAVKQGAVDRTALSTFVIGNNKAMKKLERIVHPLVQRKKIQFLRRARAQGAAVAVLDIPLLFETHGETGVDIIVVASAPAFLQRLRVLRRPGMSDTKFAGILARQVPDAKKRQQADFIIQTGLNKRHALGQVRRILSLARQASPKRRRMI